jgi:hypothetical protein
MLTKILICALTAVTVAGAQGRRGPGPGRGGPDFRLLGAQSGRPGPVVKGAPYSADVSSEVTQTLSDGNRIQQTASEKVYRDSEGRTRRETSLAALGSASGANTPTVAFIDDPVAGVSYALDLSNRTATKTPFRQPPPNGPRPNFQSRQRASDPNSKTESLGRQIVAGVPADGTRTTRTIPAGQVGNLLPITIVTERWYSPDLQTVVLEKRSDPRSGETVFQLTDISRAEPSSTLFAPSADFQVTQGPARQRRQPPAPPQ